jgi:hypothetical protein
MRPKNLRSQDDIADRILDAIRRGDNGDEYNEYMRCAKFIPLALRDQYEDTTEDDWQDAQFAGRVTCDDASVIDKCARVMLPFLDKAIRTKPRHATTILRQFKAWKWLLGHSDADTFLSPSADELRTGKYDLSMRYELLSTQMATAAWDNLGKKERRVNEKSKRVGSAWAHEGWGTVAPATCIQAAA